MLLFLIGGIHGFGNQIAAVLLPCLNHFIEFRIEIDVRLSD